MASYLDAELLLTSPKGFALTTASKLQRAICRIVSGKSLAELGTDPDVLQSMGITTCPDFLMNPKAPPKDLIIISGIRCGKSLMTANFAYAWSQNVDVSKLRKGEKPRISILATDKDKASAVLDHLVGSVEASPLLKQNYLGPFRNESIAGILLKHPTGMTVEVAVVAGAKAGSSVISRWSAGCIFDEAPRMNGAEDGVINWDDTHKAVEHRVLPNASIISVGSPWSPFGPIYERYINHFGNPTESMVVIKAAAGVMNPVYWTPERVDQARIKNLASYRTDILADFADLEESLFISEYLDAATLGRSTEDVPYVESQFYIAAMDPATRGNAWPFMICTLKDGVRDIVAYREWKGSPGAPLNPVNVLADIAKVCYSYGIKEVYTDIHHADSLRSIAEKVGLGLSIVNITQENKFKMFEELRLMFSNKEILMPNAPQLIKDLRVVKKRVTQNGVNIVLPRTSDGRHCDSAMTLALITSRHIDAELQAGPTKGSKAYWENEAAELKRKALEESVRKKNASYEENDPQARNWYDETPLDD